MLNPDISMYTRFPALLPVQCLCAANITHSQLRQKSEGLNSAGKNKNKANDCQYKCCNRRRENKRQHSYAQ